MSEIFMDHPPLEKRLAALSAIAPRDGPRPSRSELRSAASNSASHFG